ncbi:MAG: FHA domain-containing protein [Hyphomonadaceae bacterium]
MTLPLIFRNAGGHGRALFASELWIRQGAGERVRQPIPWERLNAGQSASWTLQTQPLQQTGRQSFEVILVVASRARWREEKFALAANMEIGVEDDGRVVVNQTINVAGGEVAGAGHTVYAPIRIESDSRSHVQEQGSKDPSPLALSRADGFERERRLRGTTHGLVDRTVKLEWKGFSPDEAGPLGPIITSDGMLALGRSRLKSQEGVTDVRLTVRDAAGRLNRVLSEEISRRHIDLFVQNGALCVRASGKAGLRVNDQGLRQGEVIALGDGDRLVVLPRRPTALALDVRFEVHHGVVELVTLTRVPATPGEASSNIRMRAGS